MFLIGVCRLNEDTVDLTENMPVPSFSWCVVPSLSWYLGLLLDSVDTLGMRLHLRHLEFCSRSNWKFCSHHQGLPLGSQTHSGDLTYYSPGLGACGVTSSANDDIVSISHIIFDAASSGSDPNANPLCKHKVRALRNGKSLDLTVVDRCNSMTVSQLEISCTDYNL